MFAYCIKSDDLERLGLDIDKILNKITGTDSFPKDSMLFVKYVCNKCNKFSKEYKSELVYYYKKDMIYIDADSTTIPLKYTITDLKNVMVKDFNSAIGEFPYKKNPEDDYDFFNLKGNNIKLEYLRDRG